jgi:hypothetical protein
MEHHHAKALDRLDQLSPILLDNTQIDAKVSAKLENFSNENIKSMVEAVA